MKLSFKVQQYQTDAVNSIAKVFEGQSKNDESLYTRDLGRASRINDAIQLSTDADTGYKNADIELDDNALLENLHKVQRENNIPLASNIEKALGACQLDVEMETGTGKTYVYIKTMFELNRLYGWNKFIVVVPSIAIREGVFKTFSITSEHFMNQYGKKARFFIYDSARLQSIDNFAKDANINVMIINTGAFNKDFDNDDKANIIFRRQDSFQSRRPIDVISANRPILILDEPQKMGKSGSKTQEALKKFKPLFTLYFSATHTEKHNQTYVLDALDAYNKKLVKKIQVKGFKVEHLPGKDGYLYLESIVVSKQAPQAKVEMEVKFNSGIKRVVKLLKKGDNLLQTSKGLNEYANEYVVSEIDPTHNCLTFTNGVTIYGGKAIGDVAENDIRRIQIRETILSHFNKEQELFEKGIKTLSLFFIDEVAKYRIYDSDGKPSLGEYGEIFETEYEAILKEKLDLFNSDTEYGKYLRRDNVHQIHNGYFSVDKKGHSVDSTTKRGSDISDDVSAYDLILKNKEKLLDLKTPTRFIFSHSALREGWDNPNVFQICTLKNSNSATSKRQEVGRGMRLCVNQLGERQDSDVLGDEVHKTNLLTVIASESYEDFAGNLQKEIVDVLFSRPTHADTKFFTGKVVKDASGNEKTISDQEASLIVAYLSMNNYINEHGDVLPAYSEAKANGTLVHLDFFPQLKPYEDAIHTLVQSIFDPSVVNNMITDAHKAEYHDNKLNDNFKKKEFQELWKRINHKYAYTVSFDSNELIKKAVAEINTNLNVAILRYSRTIGTQLDNLTREQIEAGKSFNAENAKTMQLKNYEYSNIAYDVVGDIAHNCKLTRKTVLTILSQLKFEKQRMFVNNPEEFIRKVSDFIMEQKATMIVEHISYTQTDEEPYDSNIFTAEKHADYSKAVQPLPKKHITDYLFVDGIADESTEKKFAEKLEQAEEVCVYAKLPKGFHIPTPVGNYSPDWAIAFEKDSVKHIYFVAETKGSMESMQLRKIEETKISCAQKLFDSISTSNVKYGKVASYDDLLTLVSATPTPQNS